MDDFDPRPDFRFPEGVDCCKMVRIGELSDMVGDDCGHSAEEFGIFDETTSGKYNFGFGTLPDPCGTIQHGIGGLFSGHTNHREHCDGLCRRGGGQTKSSSEAASDFTTVAVSDASPMPFETKKPSKEDYELALEFKSQAAKFINKRKMQNSWYKFNSPVPRRSRPVGCSNSNPFGEGPCKTSVDGSTKISQLLNEKEQERTATIKKSRPLQLLDLPVDVLKGIVKEVTHTDDLTALALTHSTFHNLAIPQIYSRFDIVWPGTHATTDSFPVLNGEEDSPAIPITYPRFDIVRLKEYATTNPFPVVNWSEKSLSTPTWLRGNEIKRREWLKDVDDTHRPFKCSVDGCDNSLGFSSTACLLRHEREAHGMHRGSTRATLFCPDIGCLRHTWQPFSRHQDLHRHILWMHSKKKPTYKSVYDDGPLDRLLWYLMGRRMVEKNIQHQINENDIRFTGLLWRIDEKPIFDPNDEHPRVDDHFNYFGASPYSSQYSRKQGNPDGTHERRWSRQLQAWTKSLPGCSVPGLNITKDLFWFSWLDTRERAISWEFLNLRIPFANWVPLPLKGKYDEAIGWATSFLSITSCTAMRWLWGESMNSGKHRNLSIMLHKIQRAVPRFTVA